MIYRTAAHEAIANAFKGHFHGYIPDDASGRYQKPASLFLKTPTAAVAQASLVGCEAPIFNQGETGSCFPTGTPILMADGSERSIEQIDEGNEVRTHNGKIRSVTKTFCRSYEGPIYTLRLKGYAYGLRMTGEHPVCVAANGSARAKWQYEPGELRWVQAKDLKPTDVVLMPAKLDEEPRSPAILELAQLIEAPIQIKECRVRLLCTPARSAIPVSILADDRFARFVGLFLAEGSYRKSDGRPHGINFTFARHERNYQQFVIETARSIFGVEAVLCEYDTRPSVSDVRIENATLAHVMLAICGEYALHKRVSRIFFEAPRDVRLALLRGWLEGDGSHEIVRIGKRSAQIHGCTSSISLHRGMFRLALSCGLKPGAQIRTQEEHQNAPARTLSFYSRDIFEIFPEAKADVEAAGLPTEGPAKYWRHALGFLCRVSSIEVEETEAPIDVFNLEVEGEHTYIAENIAVHNCGGHGTAQAVYTALNAAGFSPLTVPSPRILYALARIMQRTNASQGLADSGVMPSDLLTVLRQYGIKPMAPTVTPDGRYSDVWGPGDLIGLPLAQPNVNTEPDLLDLETSGLKLLTGEYRIDESDPTLAQQILASINAKAPGGVGIFVDSAFMQWDPSTGPIKSINLGDPQGGGHWLALTYGYTTPAGVVVLGGPNSWGAEWPVTAGSGVPGSPYWKPGHWEVEAPGLQAAMSDCLLFPVKVLS
jgi:hypothetical protein